MEVKGIKYSVSLCDLASGSFWMHFPDVVEAFYPTIFKMVVDAPGLIDWITRVSEDINGEGSVIHNRNLELSRQVKRALAEIERSKNFSRKNGVLLCEEAK